MEKKSIATEQRGDSKTYSNRYYEPEESELCCSEKRSEKISVLLKSYAQQLESLHDGLEIVNPKNEGSSKQESKSKEENKLMGEVSALTYSLKKRRETLIKLKDLIDILSNSISCLVSHDRPKLMKEVSILKQDIRKETDTLKKIDYLISTSSNAVKNAMKRFNTEESRPDDSKTGAPESFIKTEGSKKVSTRPRRNAKIIKERRRKRVQSEKKPTNKKRKSPSTTTRIEDDETDEEDMRASPTYVEPVNKFPRMES
jgi:uncharacterized phage infection (PIP) family protein YhgE